MEKKIMQNASTDADNATAITTPDSVETRIGPLKFERGFPTADTTRRVFDECPWSP